MQLPPTRWCVIARLHAVRPNSVARFASAASFVVTRPASPKAPRFLLGRTRSIQTRPMPPAGIAVCAGNRLRGIFDDRESRRARQSPESDPCPRTIQTGARA